MRNSGTYWDNGHLARCGGAEKRYVFCKPHFPKVCYNMRDFSRN